MNIIKNSKQKFIFANRNLFGGFLFGLGLVAFIDETVFHQLLHWHHFYDKSTTDIGLVSDGLFHAFSWFATIFSAFMFADLRRRNAFGLQDGGEEYCLGLEALICMMVSSNTSS